jgi:hypothetical protein
MGQYLANVAGAAIGYALVAIAFAFRRRFWTGKAHKLAAASDIALPEALVPKVARFLRGGYLLGTGAMLVVFTPLFSTLATPIGGRHHSAHMLPWLVAGLPLASAAILYLSTLWPRWTTSGPYRLTHLRRLPIRQTFTSAEMTVTVIGAVNAIAAGGWGLWLAAAPAWWWCAFAAACGLAIAAWLAAASTIMNRPSSASDTIELGWDDLIRFSHVRGLTLGAAWLPALLIFMVDYMDYYLAPQLFVTTTTSGGTSVTAFSTTTLWPLFLPFAAFLIVLRVFRQGRQLWRTAWLTDSLAPR